MYMLVSGFGPNSGRTWPRDACQRVRLGNWCGTRPTLASEPNYDALSLQFCGPCLKLICKMCSYVLERKGILMSPENSCSGGVKHLLTYLPSFRIGNNKYNLNFVFWPVSGRTWPRDPLKRVGLEKWCRNHPQLTPETICKPVSWPFSGPDP